MCLQLCGVSVAHLGFSCSSQFRWGFRQMKGRQERVDVGWGGGSDIWADTLIFSYRMSLTIEVLCLVNSVPRYMDPNRAMVPHAGR